MQPRPEEMNNETVVSQVSELYADYPYPNHRVISGVVAGLLKRSVTSLSVQLGRTDLDFLDAGCGTGEQTLGVLRANPRFRATGIDYSNRSLAVARELSKAHNLPVHFERRNLMELMPGLGTFDVITSIGVLHSLPDPAVGFRHLRSLARPHTIFLGMVYGSVGKWDLFQVRDALALLCGPDASRHDRLAVLRDGRLAINTGVRHYLDVFRRRMRFGPRIAPLEAARRVLAGRNAAYQADSYTHVQEVTYTWRELIDLLESTGWCFLGWPEKSGMPDRPGQVFRGRALELARRRSQRELASIYEKIVKPENLFFLATPA